MIRRPPRSTQSRSSAASDVYKRQVMDLSIIIVSWQVKERLKANLKALFSSEGDFKFEVFVVDNNSSDGSVGMVRNNFPRVTIVENQENLGFSKANNQAIKLANGRFILLLNPDM